jgi:hypothetical protein
VLRLVLRFGRREQAQAGLVKGGRLGDDSFMADLLSYMVQGRSQLLGKAANASVIPDPARR